MQVKRCMSTGPANVKPLASDNLDLQVASPPCSQSGWYTLGRIEGRKM